MLHLILYKHYACINMNTLRHCSIVQRRKNKTSENKILEINNLEKKNSIQNKIRVEPRFPFRCTRSKKYDFLIRYDVFSFILENLCVLKRGQREEGNLLRESKKVKKHKLN